MLAPEDGAFEARGLRDDEVGGLPP